MYIKQSLVANYTLLSHESAPYAVTMLLAPSAVPLLLDDGLQFPQPGLDLEDLLQCTLDEGKLLLLGRWLLAFSSAF